MKGGRTAGKTQADMGDSVKNYIAGIGRKGVTWIKLAQVRICVGLL
jgi:hypothetical protein